MANSAAEPPDEGRPAPEGDELDETEMTSIMDADQRRQLQRAARALKHEKEPERETARPPPEAAEAMEAEAAIPKAAAVPAEALAIQPAVERAVEPDEEVEPTSPPARRDAPAPSPVASPVWMVVAFVLLAAAIAFEMR